MNGWGMSSGWWLFMSLFWVPVIVLIVWAVARLLSGRSDETLSREGPEEILDRRLARGEIDPDSYETLRAKLSGSGRALSRR